MKNIFKATLTTIILVMSINLFAKDLSHEQIYEYYNKSYGYEKAGNYIDAIKAIQLVYEKYPNTYTINSRLGSLYRLNGKFRNSIEHYRKALKVIPASISAKLGLQYTYLLSEDYDMVLMLGYQIISVDYYNYYANYRIAYSLSQDGKLDMSETIINKMLAIYPSDVLFLTELGLLQLKQKKPTIAKTTLLNVLILDPENVRAKSSLLNIYE
jgi:tetratricopeptide (TPR) repeat protein